MLKILEKHLQKYGEDLLELDGWHIFRAELNFSEKKMKSVGELGAPDCLAIRYLSGGTAEVLFIEWKRKGKKPTWTQRIWHIMERERGALVWVAGEDFEPSVAGFKAKYEASGLCRRKLVAT